MSSDARAFVAAALGAWVALGVFGVFLHFAADMQKHTSLRLRPGVLLTVACDGVLERYRYTVDGRHIRLVSAVKYSQLGPFVAIALGAFSSVVIAAAALVFLRLAKER